MVAPSKVDQLPSPSPSGGGGGKRGSFFSVYKKGQGTVTRLSTGIAAALLLLVVTGWVVQQSRPRLSVSFQNPERARDVAEVMGRNAALGIGAVILLVGAVLAWRLMNSPKGAEFLITTDSEMKKVNWASRKEVFGSTRVVVIFLFFIASFLFVADIFFSWFFHLIGVLRAGPFG